MGCVSVRGLWRGEGSSAWGPASTKGGGLVSELRVGRGVAAEINRTVGKIDNRIGGPSKRKWPKNSEWGPNQKETKGPGIGVKWKRRKPAEVRARAPISRESFNGP